MMAFRPAVVLALAGTSASRQTPEARVVVPDAPGGAFLPEQPPQTPVKEGETLSPV